MNHISFVNNIPHHHLHYYYTIDLFDATRCPLNSFSHLHSKSVIISNPAYTIILILSALGITAKIQSGNLFFLILIPKSIQVMFLLFFFSSRYPNLPSLQSLDHICFLITRKSVFSVRITNTV